MALLTDRAAVVTGGASGIGRGIAIEYANQGADVVVADVREEPKEEGSPTHEVISEETDRQATYVACDVTEVDDLEAAVAAADEFGGIDVMVNNAGIWRPEAFFEVTEEAYQQMMDINMKGVYFGSQAAARRMVDGDGGSIVNVASVDAVFGHWLRPTYSASKAGVLQFSRSLAHGLGEHDVRVNAILPGAIETMIGPERPAEPTPEQQAAAGQQREEIIAQIPQGRMGQPEDVAGPAVFLASDMARYVTGTSLVADGGWTCWR